VGHIVRGTGVWNDVLKARGVNVVGRRSGRPAICKTKARANHRSKQMRGMLALFNLSFPLFCSRIKD
jgi:hypothetical protein